MPVRAQKKLKRSKRLNKKTRKAIENIERGKNLVTAKNAKDLFEKLGI